MVLFKKWANPRIFLIYFCLFKHKLQNLHQINVKKCPSSKLCRDSNTQPLEHQSLPITTDTLSYILWSPLYSFDSSRGA